MNREDLQQDAIRLIRRNPRVALLWATGLGKSRVAIEMANYLQSRKRREN